MAVTPLPSSSVSDGNDGLDEDGQELSIVYSEKRSDIHHAAPLDCDNDCDNDSSSSIYSSPVEDEDDGESDEDWDQDSSEDMYEIYGEGELDPDLFLEL